MTVESAHDTDRCDWTNHPDANPALTHCPSCGEPVDEATKSDEDPPRCPECDRDLRLPRYAISAARCLCCKVPVSEADDGVIYTRLATGERICSTCTADLRAFKYELEMQTFVAEWLPDDFKMDLSRAVHDVTDAHEAELTFSAQANARYGRLEVDPEESRGLADALTVDPENLDVDPEELPEALRAAVDEEGSTADAAGEATADAADSEDGDV